MLVSVSFILLDQCSVAFSEATILGIKIYLEKDHLQKLFFILAVLFCAMFTVRIWMTGGWDRYYAYQAIRTQQRNGALEAYGLVSGFGVLQYQKDGSPYYLGQKERSAEGRKIVDQYTTKYARLAMVDQTVFFVTEVVPPISFFILAFFSNKIELYQLVCPGSPIGWPQP